VIGGTQFIGRQFVMRAVAAGHEVTLFNRGNKPAPEGVADIMLGDRNSDLDKLKGLQFDAVVDTSAYLPRQVRQAAQLLEPTVGRYLFISTISVYADTSQPYLNEDAELVRLPDPTTEQVTNETYGGLKVLCEEELAAAWPRERCWVLRPTLVAGPDDPTDRFTYWPVRVQRGGNVLAPGAPGKPLQWIDVRDLADWMLYGLRTGLSGTFNAVSEADRFDFGTLLAACAEEVDGNPELTWVDERFLLDKGVRPFADLPFWLPAADENLFRIDGGRAFQAGLAIRSARETVSATLEWQRQRGDPKLKIGLDAQREEELLNDWKAH
jgi:2'-hydroxyisoflavone reductase